MNFVLHSSDLFSAVLVVSMVSIMDNNKDEKALDFYIIEHDISEEHKQMIMLQFILSQCQISMRNLDWD